MRYSKLFDLYRYILMVVSFGFRQACGTWLDRRNESFALSEHKGPRPRYGKWFQVKFVVVTNTRPSTGHFYCTHRQTIFPYIVHCCAYSKIDTKAWYFWLIFKNLSFGID